MDRRHFINLEIRKEALEPWGCLGGRAVRPPNPEMSWQRGAREAHLQSVKKGRIDLGKGFGGLWAPELPRLPASALLNGPGLTRFRVWA